MLKLATSAMHNNKNGEHIGSTAACAIKCGDSSGKIWDLHTLTFSCDDWLEKFCSVVFTSLTTFLMVLWQLQSKTRFVALRGNIPPQLCAE